MVDGGRTACSARDHRQTCDDALEDVLGNADGAIDSPAFSRKADHDHARLVEEEAADGVLVDLEAFGDFCDGKQGVGHSVRRHAPTIAHCKNSYAPGADSVVTSTTRHLSGLCGLDFVYLICT
jgi:hypothetical protein